MALFEVLRRQTNRGHTKNITGGDGADLTTIGKNTAGSAFLYVDTNTTSVTIGGGASLSALCDLRDTNTTVLRSSSGQDLQLHANGASEDIILLARGATYNLNDAANTALTTTNQTIIGAINELVAAEKEEDVLATITGIDAKTVGTTNLFTSVGTTVITKVMLLCSAATAITVGATAGVGIAAGEDDIFPPEPLTGLITTNKIFNFLEAGTRVVALDTEVVKLGIDTAATGTSQTLTAYVFGFTV